MTIRFHPDDATLASYAAGTLSQPFAIVVASHAELCPRCRRNIRALTALGAILAEEIAPSPVNDSEFDRLLQRLPNERAPARPAPQAGVSSLPRAVARLAGGSLANLPWQTVMPGAELHTFQFPVRGSTHTLRLLRAEPGRSIPEHGHSGPEMTMVLQGELRDGALVYGAGDVAERGDDMTHEPTVTGGQPCICMIAEEGPPHFVSPEVAAYMKQKGI